MRGDKDFLEMYHHCKRNQCYYKEVVERMIEWEDGMVRDLG